MDDFIWKGKNLRTTNDLLSAAKSCPKEEAAEFMERYQSVCSTAQDNLGYLAGYLSRESAQEIYEKFNIEHPIFGKMSLSAEQVMQMGLRIAELTMTRPPGFDLDKPEDRGSLLYADAIKKVREEFGIPKKEENPWSVGI